MVNRLEFLFVLLFLPFVLKAQENKVAINYMVKSGDTYSNIAISYQTKVDSLKKWNPTVTPSLIQPGQSIIVGYEKVSDDEIGERTIVLENSDSVNIDNTNSIATSVSNTNSDNTSVNNENQSDKKKDKEKEKVKDNSFLWVRFLLGLLVGLVLGIVLFYLIYVKKLKDNYRCLEIELGQVKFDLDSEKTSTGSELSRLRSKIQSLDREKQRLFEENVSLGEEIDRLKAAQSRTNENRMEQTASASTDQASTQLSGSPAELYADAIIDGCFVRISEVPNDDSIFVLHLNGENSAYFDIYGPAHPRIIANPSFLEGCEKQILGNTMQLDVIEGRAQRDASNGKWKVIEKLNVIIK